MHTKYARGLREGKLAMGRPTLFRLTLLGAQHEHSGDAVGSAELKPMECPI